MNKAMKYLTPKKPISKIAHDRAEEMEERNDIAFPADYRSLENRQAFIRHDQIFIATEHLPETFASRAGA